MPPMEPLYSYLSPQSIFFFLIVNSSMGAVQRAFFALRQWFMGHLRGSVSSMCPLSEGVRTSKHVSDYHMPVLVPIRSSAGVRGAGERLIPDMPSPRSKFLV